MRNGMKAVIASLWLIPVFCAVIDGDVNELKTISDDWHAVNEGSNGSYDGRDVRSDSSENGDERNGIFRLEYDDISKLTAKVMETPRLGRGKKDGKKNGGFLQKVLPFMAIPFMISSSIIPIALTALKFMLLKSAFVGKMAIILLLINMFVRFNNQGGVYSHNVDLTPYQKDVAMSHYGYNGDEEYGAYIHHRRRR